MSFGRWRQQLHVGLALQRLADGESVTNIAIDLGYERPSAFTAMFRRMLGTTPARYLTETATEMSGDKERVSRRTGLADAARGDEKHVEAGRGGEHHRRGGEKNEGEEVRHRDSLESGAGIPVYHDRGKWQPPGHSGKPNLPINCGLS